MINLLFILPLLSIPAIVRGDNENLTNTKCEDGWLDETSVGLGCLLLEKITLTFIRIWWEQNNIQVVPDFIAAETITSPSLSQLLGSWNGSRGTIYGGIGLHQLERVLMRKEIKNWDTYEHLSLSKMYLNEWWNAYSWNIHYTCPPVRNHNINPLGSFKNSSLLHTPMVPIAIAIPAIKMESFTNNTMILIFLWYWDLSVYSSFCQRFLITNLACLFGWYFQEAWFDDLR